MDNQIFKVNGVRKEDLQDTLNLIINLKYRNSACTHTIEGWKFIPNKGLVLYWCLADNQYVKDPKDFINSFPAKLNADQATEIVWQWLQTSEEAKNFKNEETWENNFVEGRDTDVMTKKGWTVYLEDWGQVKSSFYTICAIRPSWAWYGK